MLAFILTGIVCGFGSSAPLGPINLWLIRSVFEKIPAARVAWFLTGVILTDLTYAGLAAWGHQSLSFISEFSLAVSVVGGTFLILLGIFQLRSLRQQRPEQGKARGLMPQLFSVHASLSAFASGVVFCGANPGFLMFWITVFHEIPERLGRIPDFSDIPFFLAGVALGDLLWFGSLLKIASFGSGYAGQKILFCLRLVVACGFTLCGLWFLLSALRV
ncbi:MAG: LysE family transporter [Deltaproteobacteria bacterium]|nr:LysE family transporter [Deltaproteobacteria bacterium]